jgi:hypothetical protein
MLHGLFSDADAALGKLGGGAGDEVMNEGWNLVAAFAQGGIARRTTFRR